MNFTTYLFVSNIFERNSFPYSFHKKYERYLHNHIPNQNGVYKF